MQFSCHRECFCLAGTWAFSDYCDTWKGLPCDTGVYSADNDRIYHMQFHCGDSLYEGEKKVGMKWEISVLVCIENIRLF